MELKAGKIGFSERQESSQFASALLLSSRAGEWDVSIPAGANPDELPYVDRFGRVVRTRPDMLRFVFEDRKRFCLFDFAHLDIWIILDLFHLEKL